jgi:hypothetical protein
VNANHQHGRRDDGSGEALPNRFDRLAVPLDDSVRRDAEGFQRSLRPIVDIPVVNAAAPSKDRPTTSKPGALLIRGVG